AGLVRQGNRRSSVAVAAAATRSGGDRPAARPGQQDGAGPAGGRPAHAGHRTAVRARKYAYQKTLLTGDGEMSDPVDQATIDLIKRNEGCRLNAYQDSVSV